jgi:hypothetical protein
MNDAFLNWKKIRRIFPRARRYALDGISTVDEIREIIDAADQRGKALTLVFLTSGVREAAIEYFTMQDYSTIQGEGKIVAGRLVDLSIKKEKCFIKYPDHTLELTKSPNENESVMEVHLSEVYTFDPYQGLLKQYDIARYHASLAAQRLRLVISDNGRLVKKPHLAFERDLIDLYLATFQTGEISTIKGGGGRKEKAWIDSSKGSGELETNDVNYAYKYLMMPEIVMDIQKAVNRIARQTAGYERHYHPIMTYNN